MPPDRLARPRLVALWVAVLCHACVMSAATTYTITALQSRQYHSFNPPAIAAWLGLSCIPALLLTPLIGALANSRRAWETLVFGSAISAAMFSWALLGADVSWLSVLGLLALASAFFVAAALRLIFTVLPIAGVRSTTAMVLFTLGAVMMSTIGFELGLGLRDELPSSPARSTYVAIGCSWIALIASVFARIRPSEFVSLSRGVVRPFIEGSRETTRVRRARNALLALWLWAFFAGAMIVLVMRLIVATDDPRPETSISDFTLRFASSTLWGVVLSALNRNLFRFGWLIFYAVIAIFVCLAWLRFAESADGPLIGIGLALGASLPALVHYYFTCAPAKHLGVASALLVAGWCAIGLALGGLTTSLNTNPSKARSELLDILAVIAGATVILSLRPYYRPAVEGTAEFLLWPMYRVRAVGPGVGKLPTLGPCLVIGNHAAWFDPLFIAKVIPRPVTPMMTSKFYDLPVLSWLMRRVIGTIRVPDVPFRHEAPELNEAVKRLDRGDCIVLFPEGYLRRKEEQPLRRFGRGVWKILSDRPNTPLFACWIEGNWGSFFSHRSGPPTKGKRIDFWTHINIGIIGPITIEPAMLADHMATRLFLMQQVIAARTALDLPAIELPTVAAEGDKE